ncbi:NAD-dependent protein deacylase [Enhygromyxa salina]|nr:NAD-dependent protein deacylase [Enhygromyxa salina]
MDSQRDLIERAAKRLAPAQSILFVTGAGISADSGLPTYRGVGGLYDQGETEDGLPIEACLSGPMFRAEPSRTWKYIREIEQACRGAKPNTAHARIAELERSRERVWVLTQNVDGLHAAAGSEQILDIHGDVHQLICTACAWRDRVTDYSEFDGRLATDTPSCPECGAVIRPDVVLFGELLPRAKIERLQRELERGFDAVISIGTTAVFPYISAPVLATRAAGGLTIEINPGTSEVSDLVDIHLRLGAAAAMQALV